VCNVIGGQEQRPTVVGEIGSSIGQAAIEHKPLPLYSNPVESEFARIGSYRQQFSFSFAVMVGSGTYRQQAWLAILALHVGTGGSGCADPCVESTATESIRLSGPIRELRRRSKTDLPCRGDDFGHLLPRNHVRLFSSVRWQVPLGLRRAMTNKEEKRQCTVVNQPDLSH
jgi:hypothetical protein